jgi:hypothetical protein
MGVVVVLTAAVLMVGAHMAEAIPLRAMAVEGMAAEVALL